MVCAGPCSVTDPCPDLANCLCELDGAGPAGICVTCPANRITCGPVCCPNGQICADAATGTCAVPGCVPDPIEVACAGLACGPASNGCGQDYECGTCGRKKGKKGKPSRKQICVSGVCKATGKKRCVGSGLAGQPCSGKCKCEGDRRCNNGRCCEQRGDGTQHCQANNDCCPGLVCARRRPGQHKVCIRRNAKGEGDFTGIEETSAPSLAIGAILTGLALKGGERWFGSAGSNAPIALDELRKEGERTEA